MYFSQYLLNFYVTWSVALGASRCPEDAHGRDRSRSSSCSTALCASLTSLHFTSVIFSPFLSPLHQLHQLVRPRALSWLRHRYHRSAHLPASVPQRFNLAQLPTFTQSFAGYEPICVFAFISWLFKSRFRTAMPAIDAWGLELWRFARVQHCNQLLSLYCKLDLTRITFLF